MVIGKTPCRTRSELVADFHRAAMSFSRAALDARSRLGRGESIAVEELLTAREECTRLRSRIWEHQTEHACCRDGPTSRLALLMAQLVSTAP